MSQSGRIVEDLVKKVLKVLNPIVGDCTFREDLTLSYKVGSSAIWIAIKEKRGRIIVDIGSPVIINPKITDGLLESLNSYNVEETVTLVYVEGKVNMVIARCEIDGEFFNEKEMALKLKQVTDHSLSLSHNLKVFWAGETFEEFRGE
jgi:hypothetical protein